jgi:hypothetical protein
MLPAPKRAGTWPLVVAAASVPAGWLLQDVAGGGQGEAGFGGIPAVAWPLVHVSAVHAATNFVALCLVAWLAGGGPPQRARAWAACLIAGMLAGPAVGWALVGGVWLGASGMVEGAAAGLWVQSRAGGRPAARATAAVLAITIGSGGDTAGVAAHAASFAAAWLAARLLVAPRGVC